MPFTNPLVAGLELIRQAIRSRNYVPNTSGWTINADGTAEFTDATIRGQLLIGDPNGAHILGDVTDAPELVPFIEIFSGDSDESQPATITNDPIPVTGRIPLTFISSLRDDSGNRASIELFTGSDAAPGDTFVSIEAQSLMFVNDLNFIFNNTGFDIDGIFTVDAVSGTPNPTLNIFGLIEQHANDPVPARIATTEDITASGAISTVETIVLTVTGSLISGLKYRISAYFVVGQSVATDEFVGRIREDNATGSIKTTARIRTGSVSTLFPVYFEAEYTAVATGSKTFVVTLIRSTGTGTIINNASSTAPGYLYIDYVRV